MFKSVMIRALIATLLATGSTWAGTEYGRRQRRAHADDARSKPPACTARDSSLPASSSASKTSKRYHGETEMAAGSWRQSSA
jgi:hypothetical protein